MIHDGELGQFVMGPSGHDATIRSPDLSAGDRIEIFEGAAV